MSPQQPAAQTAPATEQAAPSAQAIPDPQDPRKQLAQLEKAGEYADATELARLANHDNQAIAARATWLLAHSKNPAHLNELPAIIESNPHAEARLQALQGIRLHGDASALPIAVGALEDLDRRVRTLAVQVLGKLRRPASVAPLLQLVRTESINADGSPATDIQAALLTLSDFGAAEHLLRMAADVADGNAVGCGEALTYAFQNLSPKLGATKETTALIAVLDHKEPLLRRYAITRLTELGDAKTATALQGRLGQESPELRPLLEVAIAQLQNEGTAPPTDEFQRATENAKVLGSRIMKWWNGLDTTYQAMFGAIPVVLIILMMIRRRAARRRAHEADAQAAAALVAPSDEYLEDQQDYAEDDEYEYDEDGEYEDEEAYDDDTQEASEWDDDVHAVGTGGAEHTDGHYR